MARWPTRTEDTVQRLRRSLHEDRQAAALRLGQSWRAADQKPPEPETALAAAGISEQQPMAMCAEEQATSVLRGTADGDRQDKKFCTSSLSLN